jgi:hypothetical protein
MSNTQTEYVGVAAFLNHVSRGGPTNWTKRYALLFDAIVVTDLFPVRLQLETSANADMALIGDIDYLKDQGFLRESQPYYLIPETDQKRDLQGLPPELAAQFQRSTNEFKASLDHFNQISAAYERQRRHAPTGASRGGQSSKRLDDFPLLQEQALGDENFTAFVETMDDQRKALAERKCRVHALSTRQVALQLRMFGDTNALSLEPIETVAGASAVDRPINSTKMYEIIVRNIPIPDERISWEDLLSFRREPDFRQRVLALRVWLDEVIDGKLTYAQAAQKIEYLVGEFRAHMDAAGLSSSASILKTCVVGTAYIAEHVAKLKLGKLAEQAYGIFEANAKLVEAESKAPGRQLSCIVRAVERFGETH